MNWLIISQTAIALFSFLGVVISSFNNRKITKVRLEINGRMDQLLRTAKDLSHAEGYKEGRDRKRNAPRAKNKILKFS